MADAPTALPYPVALVVEGWPCLVVGAGPVAARRIGGLLDSGSRLTVVAPHVATPVAAYEARGRLVVERRPYRPGEAARYRLVVAATGVPAVDDQVVRDAEEAGVLANRPARGGPGSFLVPAVHRQGAITVAVSTAGGSPAMAAWLRRRLAAAVGPEVATLVDLVSEERPSLLDQDPDWPKLFDEAFVHLARGDVQAARALVRRSAGGHQGA